jgi:hypothetical protein
MTQVSSPDQAPKLRHKPDGVIDRADGNSDERGEDKAVEEVTESGAHRVADYVRVFAREREHVGQVGFDALVHRARLCPALTTIAHHPARHISGVAGLPLGCPAPGQKWPLVRYHVPKNPVFSMHVGGAAQSGGPVGAHGRGVNTPRPCGPSARYLLL